ncbi:heat shock factor-d isoform X4 [Bombyx mori]|uniref:HSF-type DNA-binding domain-containing protein n=1 Tax=Bombyx mori TaxID=7091 RepID=A0A8R2QWN6_BOMMO|nr:heat shock factor-d isoform X4 [Bombyx mori]
MRSVVEIGASVPAFLGKLWKLVNDSETNQLISWSPGGKTFVIKNQADFARELLPLYYKHNNMASFIRQLNMYGFHKITSVENGGLRYEKDEIEFSHPCFMKGHAYLLEHIKRKIAIPKSVVTSNESGEKILLKPELMNKVLADVKQMKGKQESLDAKFSAMKQENEALWREVAILRQKHIKQQQIVNNLIQFLMSLVQPARPPNTNGNNVGVKRPYQLMINNAAHNSATESSYPGRLKNIKLDKDPLLEEISDENLEDGPTIHELAHDDILQNESSQDAIDPTFFVATDLNNITDNQNVANPLSNIQYHVTMEDGDDIESGGNKIAYPVKSNRLRFNEDLPVITSPSPTQGKPSSPLNQSPAINNVFTITPSTSKTKPRIKTTSSNTRSLISPSSFNPSADFKLPAEIFASDDSVSDVGILTAEETGIENILQDVDEDPMVSSTKDKMLGGINIKVEKVNEGLKPSKKSKKSNKDDTQNINLAAIKTELQDDFDWNNMTLATVNNNTNNKINRFQTRNDLDDHLDAMQSDLESLRELLRSDSYALDTNTLMGLFGSDDPFYGLSYNPADERAKTSNNVAKKQKGDISNLCSDENRAEQFIEDDVEGNQLISYTGNIPDFEDINMPDLESENSQEGCLSPEVSSSTLNTPQVQVRSPSFNLKP